MRQSTKLILNTSVVYARMLCTVGFGLLTIRYALKILGEDDYAIVMAMGASSAVLAVITSAVTLGTQRFLAYEIGRDDQAKIREVFNSSLVVFWMLAMLFVAVVGPQGFWIAEVLNMQDARRDEAVWVFGFSVLGVAVTLATTPFTSTLIAYQEIFWMAIWDFLKVILLFVGVVLLPVLPGDDLVVFALLRTLSLVVLLVGVMSTCAWRFPATRPRPRLLRWRLAVEMVCFSGWTSLTQIAWQMRMQGSLLVLNLFFGTAATAAYGLVMALGAYMNSLGQALLNAIRPAITGAEAREDAAGAKWLMLATGKYTVLMMLFFCVPVSLEINTVLDLWLGAGAYPSPLMQRLAVPVLIWMCLLPSGYGYTLAMQARGKVARYSIYTLIPNGLVLVGSSVAFWLAPDLPAESLPYFTLVTMMGWVVFQAWWVGRQFGAQLSEFLRQTAWPLVVVAAGAALAAACARALLPETSIRFFVVAAVYVTAALPLIWFAAMAPLERAHFARLGRSMLARIGLGKGPRPAG